MMLPTLCQGWEGGCVGLFFFGLHCCFFGISLDSLFRLLLLPSPLSESFFLLPTFFSHLTCFPELVR